jgi:hypothetical protein
VSDKTPLYGPPKDTPAAPKSDPPKPGYTVTMPTPGWKPTGAK